MWVSLLTYPFFLVLMKLGLFRLPKEIEVIGTDVSEMGGMPLWMYEKIRHQYSLTNSLLSSPNLSMASSEFRLTE